METVSNGALIYWEARGEGPPLVMLHGNGEDMSVFSAQVPEFSREFMVISIDSRGHGKSTAGGGKLSLYDMARDVVAVMDDAKIKKAHILGFSDGGNIGLIMAVKYPERVSSLVLTGANADPSGIKFKYIFPMWMEQAALTLKAPFSPEACRKKDLLDLMIREPRLRKWDLQSIKVPTLITMGEHDIISRTHGQYLHNNISGSEFHLFPGGHFTPVKRPEMYNKVVLDFFEKTGHGAVTYPGSLN
ncbi:MAG TPA: alpha/beta fold hydrolase [Clostridiales bacterium]|nr:alpha/beta fold hydrolase [Clostridiales bacterium]